MKALSIKQPWAWLIVAGHKDIENRNWKTDYRGRIYIHASKEFDHECLITQGETYANLIKLPLESFTRGAIIGEVDIVNCVSEKQFEAFKKVSSYCSPWFVGKYGFVLANAVMYDKPILYRGQLGLFDVDDNIVRAARG